MKVFPSVPNTRQEVTRLDPQTIDILEMIAQPAFLVRDHTVVWCNAASRVLLLEGSAIAPLLGKSESHYAAWSRDGLLQLSLSIAGWEYDASVRSTEAGDLFLALRHEHGDHAVAASMVKLSASLRKPLQQVFSAAGELFDTLEEEDNASQAASARLNKGLYQLMRLCGQMSDGGRLILHRKTAHKVHIDICDFLKDFVSHAAPLAEALNIRLLLELPSSPLQGELDPSLLERALYNLLSNAIRYMPKGGQVRLRAAKQEQFFMLQVCDNGEGLSTEVQSALFRPFTDPQMGDSRWGVGLGLPMAREIARLHGGTLSVGKNPDGTGTCVTMSFSLRSTTLELHSRSLPSYDYCAGLHHGLVELSDSLPADLYDPKEV